MTFRAWILGGLFALLARPLAAQFQTGQLSTNLTGSISAGYTADYGNLIGSDHGLSGGGAATLSGSYYDPNFLSFSVLPFYNQSRTNSDFQSITDSSGVNASASFFSGSNFPGFINYSRNFNSEGNFGIPGVANYTSHGNSDVFGIGWSEHVASLPSLSVNYQRGGNDYSIYGANANSESRFQSVVVSSSYLLQGFNLTGSYRYTTTDSLVPQFLFDQGAQTADSKTDSYSFGIGHTLPLRGNFSAGASRSNLTLESSTGSYDGTIDSAYTSVTLNPMNRLYVGGNMQYLDNLTGNLEQSIISAGGTVVTTLPEQSSHTLDFTSFATYEVPAVHTNFNVTEEHRDQRFEGLPLSSDAYTGTAAYANAFAGGMLNATLGVVRTSIQPANQARVGLLASLNYTRDWRKWTFSALGNYAQDQQTLLVSYTTNNLGYSLNVGRRLGRRSNWTNIASGAKSGLTDQSGTSNFSQSYISSLTISHFGFSGGYSKATGNSILTSSGLVSTPVPLPVVTPGSVILYGGRAYTFTVGASPIRGLTASVVYSNVSSTTAQGTANSFNTSNQFTTRILYLVRKLYFQAGYSRLLQNFSGSGTPPAMVGSYYVGISRWFSFL